MELIGEHLFPQFCQLMAGTLACQEVGGAGQNSVSRNRNSSFRLLRLVRPHLVRGSRGAVPGIAHPRQRISLWLSASLVIRSEISRTGPWVHPPGLAIVGRIPCSPWSFPPHRPRNPTAWTTVSVSSFGWNSRQWVQRAGVDLTVIGQLDI